MKILILFSLFILFEHYLCDEKVDNYLKSLKNCGGNFTGLQYPITSPNYPKNYPSDQNCVYILKGNQFPKSCDQEFHLQFLDFQLEASKGCEKDYLKIGTESIYCGSSFGIRRFKTQENNLKLIFHSDTNTTAKGFRILVTTLPCENSGLNENHNTSNSTLKLEYTIETKNETNAAEKNSSEIKFDIGNTDKEESPFSRIQDLSIPQKTISQNLELPEFEQHNFHDENCGHSHSVNDDGIGSITSYLYLPPSQITRPLKITSEKTTPVNSGENISSKIIPTEIIIRNFEDQIEETEPPTEFVIPLNKNPPPFLSQVIQRTRNTLQPLKHLHTSSKFHEPINKWITYGTPNSVPSANPSIPNNNNYDPFADGNVNNNNNNNNNNPGFNYNPVAPNCGGNNNNNNNNNNPNYYPNGNGNWNPNFNPVGNNFPSGGGNSVPYFPNPNFANGYPDTGINYDMNFGINGNNNPNNFVPNGNNNNNNNNNNNYPNNNFYSPVDTGTTYYDTSSSGVSQCCGTTYSSNSFILTSPGFPALIYSSSNYECQYTIIKSSESICQLQMNLKFFNFGSEDQFCAYGYLEIDGNRICGCKTGANITSSFDYIATKTLNVKYTGYPRNKFSGFVIEVTQVACSTSYLRFRNNNNYHHQNQEPVNVIRNHDREFKRSIDQIEDNNNSNLNRQRRDLTGYNYQRPNSAPITTSQNLQFINSCRIFKFLNWVQAAKQVYLRSAQCSATTTTTTTTGVSSTISVIPIFPNTGNAALINYPSNLNCQTVNLADGILSSTNYPNSYSNNLNQCFRFYKAPGYCQLEIAMLDFDLENSTICRKDYVSFSGQKRRYCGTSLNGTRTIFDMTQASFADLYFVSDSAGTGRGFRAGFTQISC